ncbi:MAG: hypothetical protein ACXVAX_01180 [Pseudobdellovibrio sp.]
MNHLTTLTSALVLCLGLTATTAFAQSEPTENPNMQVLRNANNGTSFNGSVSKNLYNSVTTQDHYTVQVPYEDTETYTVDVPYTVEVPYTDYVTDYRSEYVCHDVTNYRQECHNEVQCYDVPGNPTCHDVQECGTNVQGEPICKTRTVCEGGSSEQHCDDHQVCSNEPYTEQQCGYEQVPYQREVTGTRTETRYNTETRTRTVTKYRDEDRCCQAVTHQVFDRQLQYQVQVHFPADAVLNSAQSETINFILDTATLKTAHVTMQVVNSVYRYVMTKQQVTGATISIDLAIAPKDVLTSDDLPGLSDNSKITVTSDPKAYAATLTIQDTAPQFRDVTTSYTVTLVLKAQAGDLPLDSRTYTAAQLKASAGLVKMSDVIKDSTKALNSQSPMNTIAYKVVAVRTGTSPLLTGKTLQAVQEGSVVIK